ALSEMIVADGFSCREQISQQTGRHALHLAEVMQIAQRGRGQNSSTRPEDEIVKRREAARRKARLRALAGVSAAGASAVIAWKLLHKS
ncbi:MAG TPA: hypothetical protein VFT65_09545, partial [Candidatus Angelobacter sp.]|nr:hypothetical protein [Candidatus Angelobacter sp.]